MHGVGTEDEPGEVFFQKNLDSSAPDWLHRGTITHKTSTNTYPLVDDRATLVWLAQIASLEIHVPQWRFAAQRPAEESRTGWCSTSTRARA